VARFSPDGAVARDSVVWAARSSQTTGAVLFATGWCYATRFTSPSNVLGQSYARAGSCFVTCTYEPLPTAPITISA